tara:strand:+ start:464 stop:1195 length:732 start_codon:yes stop_codon:yes gene_type:complete
MIGHANTYDEAVDLIDKLELPSGTKMSMKKDIKYGWTWACLNPKLARNKKKDIPRFTIETLNGDYIHINNQCLQEMANHARGRIRSTDKRIKDFRRGTTKHLAPLRIAEEVSRRGSSTRSASEQYDHAMGLQSYFRDAGYGRVEVLTQDTIATQFDCDRSALDEKERTRDRAENEESTQSGNTIREERTATVRATETGADEAQGCGIEIQPRHSVMVRVANGRDGYRSKRITVLAGKVTLGDL